MKEYKELAGQTIIYGLGTIIPRVLNFLLTPLYTYTLVESDFGVIIYLYSFVAFFMVILTFGMETTFFRFSSTTKNSNVIFNNTFGIILITSFIFLVFTYFFNAKIAQWAGIGNYNLLIIYLAFIIFFDVITAIPLAKLRQENKAKFFALIRTGNVLINIGLNVFFFVICKNSDNQFLRVLYNDEIGVGYAFISNLIASFFTFLVLIPTIMNFRFRFDRKLIVDMFKYSLPLVIVGFAGMINEVSDKIFLNYLIPIELAPLKQIGIYGANYKLALLMTIFIQMFKYAAEPFFFKQSLNIDAKEIYSKVMTYFIIFCLLIFLMVTLYIDIFKLFIGEEYRVGLHIVPIVLLANMFLGIYYNLSIWYKVNDLTRLGAIISIIGLIITVVLNVVLIPVMGYFGSAIATFICYFSMLILSYFMGRKYYKINYQLKRILIYIFLAVVIYFGYNLFKSKSLVFNLIYSSFLMLVFIAFVFKVESINFGNIKKFMKNN